MKQIVCILLMLFFISCTGSGKLEQGNGDEVIFRLDGELCKVQTGWLLADALAGALSEQAGGPVLVILPATWVAAELGPGEVTRQQLTAAMKDSLLWMEPASMDAGLEPLIRKYRLNISENHTYYFGGLQLQFYHDRLKYAVAPDGRLLHKEESVFVFHPENKKEPGTEIRVSDVIRKGEFKSYPEAIPVFGENYRPFVFEF